MTMGHDPRDIAEYAYRDLQVMAVVAQEKNRVPGDGE
jgi:hypothetical protein